MAGNQPTQSAGDDEILSALAEALRESWRAGTPFVVDEAEGAAARMDFVRYAASLLPVVRRAQAAALRDAADADDAKLTRWPGSSGEWLRARADALEGGL